MIIFFFLSLFLIHLFKSELKHIIISFDIQKKAMRTILFLLISILINKQTSVVESKSCSHVTPEIITTIIPFFGAALITTTPSEFNRVVTARRDTLRFTRTTPIVTTTPSFNQPTNALTNNYQKVITVRRGTIDSNKPSEFYTPPRVYTQTLPVTTGFFEVFI
jgi:hypothetical protein